MFATLMFPLISLFSVMAMLRLVACHDVVANSREGADELTFGGIMYAAGGVYGMVATNMSIVMYQFGLCGSYLIFVARILRRIVLPGRSILSLVLVQLPILLPLVGLQQVKKFTITNLGAIVLILAALVTTFTIAAEEMERNGPREYSYVNVDHFPIFLGNAFFCLEGICMVVPTYEVMRRRQEFPAVAYVCTVCIMILFIASGLVGSLAYGTSSDDILLINLPDTRLTKLVSWAYIVAITFTFPFMLLPGIRLVEESFLENQFMYMLFSFADKFLSARTLFRWVVVLIMVAVAEVGNSCFDHFISLLGSLFGAPMAFVFPFFCHFQLVAKTTREKVIDFIFIIVGLATVVLCTGVTIYQWLSVV